MNRFFNKIAANAEKRITYIALMPVFLLKHQKMSNAKKIHAGSLPAVVMALNILSRNGLPKP